MNAKDTQDTDVNSAAVMRRAKCLYDEVSGFADDPALPEFARRNAANAKTVAALAVLQAKAGQRTEAAGGLSLAERIRAAVFVQGLLPDAVRGANTLDSARKGHEVVHGTQDEKHARWTRQAEDYRKEVARGTGKDAAYYVVAQMHCVSDRTVRRAVGWIEKTPDSPATVT